MKKVGFTGVLIMIAAFLLLPVGIYAQPKPAASVLPQEVSEVDGVPVLIKHLPDWESVRNSAALAHSVADLQKAIGERPVFGLIEFTGGTEAVTATYPQGKLLIVEFASPAVSIETDTKIKESIAGTPVVYRRIGNYNAFVFDPDDETSANALLDQIKYEKAIQWLGDNPFMAERQHRAERNFVNTTADIFLSTLLAIVSGLVVSIFLGIFVGLIFFQRRDHRRAAMSAFSDAGGMTRLNLDGFSSDLNAKGYLKD